MISAMGVRMGTHIWPEENSNEKRFAQRVGGAGNMQGKRLIVRFSLVIEPQKTSKLHRISIQGGFDFHTPPPYCHAHK